MDKIQVQNEGRPGIYVISVENAEKVINGCSFGEIHNQIQSPIGLIGADWDKESVVEFIRQADRIAIMVEPNFTEGHQLVAIGNYGGKTARLGFDVGKITKEDLIIS